MLIEPGPTNKSFQRLDGEPKLLTLSVVGVTLPVTITLPEIVPPAELYFVFAKSYDKLACANDEFALSNAKFAFVNANWSNCADSKARAKPPEVVPSWTTIVFLSVSTVISATAPVNVAVWAVFPLLNCNCVGI